MDWQAFLHLHERRHTKADWYAAQIAHVIHASNGGKRKMDTFLLQHKEPKKATNTQESHEALWLSMVSGPPKNPQPQHGDPING